MEYSFVCCGSVVILIEQVLQKSRTIEFPVGADETRPTRRILILAVLLLGANRDRFIDFFEGLLAPLRVSSFLAISERSACHSDSSRRSRGAMRCKISFAGGIR